MGGHKVSMIILAGLGWGLFAGCNKPSHQQVMTFLRGHEHATSGAAYRLAPPDIIRIESVQAPEVEGLYRIQPDGTIQNELLSNVNLVDLTPREAAAKLQKLLRHYYHDPIVNVSLDTSASRSIFMFGEVGGADNAADRTITRVPITGSDTILNLLSRYPPTANAWLSEVHVIRPEPEDPNETQELRIDFMQIVRGDLRQNIVLQEGDIVWVPPTPMAWVGHRVREILQPVGPAIQLYTTPATVEDASEVYDDEPSQSSQR